jgi:ABC-2 type transport system ATP-binding protein
MSGRVQSINDVLELTDLDTKIDTRVDDLSRGMKQRLGLARLLLHDPDLLLLDEPASGLDPRARIEMRELLKELRKMGKTIIISSHILSELGELCTRIGIIEQGEMVAEGSLEEIYVKLSIKRLIHAQITNINSEMIRNIERLNGVAGIEKDIDRIAISINEKVLSIENLHREICKLGAEIYMFQPEAMDMESAFMKLTTGKVQ